MISRLLGSTLTLVMALPGNPINQNSSLSANTGMDSLHAGIFSPILASNKSGSHFLVWICRSHGRFRCARSRHPESLVSVSRYSRTPLWANSAFAASCSWQILGSVAAHRDIASRDTPGGSWDTHQDAYSGTCRSRYPLPDI